MRSFYRFVKRLRKRQADYCASVLQMESGAKKMLFIRQHYSQGDCHAPKGTRNDELVFYHTF
ncbi:MAG: hypothetical protein IJO46_00390, partial [Thermoguttaceae bacterium]|nr:hypothetical protein [Thermoguttaceae bacterium]